jgi:hypothetical protein
MLLNSADRLMLTERVLARVQRERPGGCCTNEDLGQAIDAEAAALVAGGDFILTDGALIRRPPSPHGCDNGWISVPDPILGGLIDTRCPECGSGQSC